MRTLSVPAVAGLCALVLAACGSDDSTISTPTVAGDESGAASTPADTQSQASASSESCKKAEKPGAKSRKGKKPSANLAKGKTYTVVMTTSCGTIEIRLDTKNDPKTAASFAGLARSGFYKGLWFHRIVSGFVIQGGDPKGDGSGDAGYRVTERPPSSQKYTKGVVAMAKGGQEAPGTSSSQFFIVSGADAGLPPEYAVAGKVTKGLDVVDKIAAVPTSVDSTSQEQSAPEQAVVIEKTSVKTS